MKPQENMSSEEIYTEYGELEHLERDFINNHHIPSEKKESCKRTAN
jgi:hypothetical protein